MARTLSFSAKALYAAFFSSLSLSHIAFRIACRVIGSFSSLALAALTCSWALAECSCWKMKKLVRAPLGFVFSASLWAFFGDLAGDPAKTLALALAFLAGRSGS